MKFIELFEGPPVPPVKLTPEEEKKRKLAQPSKVIPAAAPRKMSFRYVPPVGISGARG